MSGVKIYSNYSATKSVKVVPGTPGSVKAAMASSTSNKVTWGTVAGATKYEMWCSTSSGLLFTPTNL